MPRVHYDFLSGPVSQSKETVSADRWYNQRPDPIRPALAVVAATVAGFFLPVFTGHEVNFVSEWGPRLPDQAHMLVSPVVPSGAVKSDFTGHEVVYLDKWYHPQPEPIRLVSPATLLPSGGIIPAYTGPEIIGLDKWWKQQPEPIRLVAPSTTLPSGGVWPVFSGHEVVYVSEWLGWQPDGALRPPQRLIDLTQAVEPNAGALAQSKTSVDRWYQQQPHRGIAVVPFTSSAVFYAGPVTVPASAAAPSVAGWAFNPPQAPQTRLTVPGYSVGGVGPVSTAAESTSVDRWLGSGGWPQPQPARTLVRSESVLPPYVLPPLPMLGYWPQPPAMRTLARGDSVLPPYPPGVQPPVPILAFWSQPLPARTRFVAHEQPPFVLAPLAPFDWFRASAPIVSSAPVWRTDVSFVAPAGPPPAVPVFAWYQPIVQPRRTLTRTIESAFVGPVAPVFRPVIQPAYFLFKNLHSPAQYFEWQTIVPA